MDNNKRNESLLNVIAMLEGRQGFVSDMWQQTRKQVDSAFVHAAEIEAKNAVLQKDIERFGVALASEEKRSMNLARSLDSEIKARITAEGQLKAVLKNNKAIRRANNGRFSGL